MPIYEYKCGDCGELTEFMITAQSPVEKLICKKCGSQNLLRNISTRSKSSEQSAPSGHSCCGNSGKGCSTPGSCCGH